MRTLPHFAAYCLAILLPACAAMGGAVSATFSGARTVSKQSTLKELEERLTWVDEPNTGRFDGENYNTGIVDVTDRSYPELLSAMKLTHSRLLDVRMGKLAPTARRSGAEAQ